ncbi:DNA integrity scanning protein DisA nucleotide-binding domain protein [Mycoplasma marinum]|uniref:DAC domain-containing protein n=1 Tax=Mycoplasma marinum TaxID=1937190 RepID=A0A4R0XM77_9MOLU|nr:DNA integrity scanning protein DisA nucleotide-binding domain protein [Mycoplasma marinum]TCG11634.1 hypothetical protein C4B24_01555 [Mycoplasma marinum]
MSNNTILIAILSSAGIIIILILLPYLIKFVQWAFKKNKYNTMGSSSQMRLIHQLYEATQELAATKTGAIITIVNKEKLDHLRTDGIVIDANISSSLLISIFNKKSPLHDGAVVIEGEKIKYAATYYKITQSSINNKYGARHRASMGIAEQSDAITVIVSEETGGVSIAMNSKIRPIKLASFQEEMTALLKNA